MKIQGYLIVENHTDERGKSWIGILDELSLRRNIDNILTPCISIGNCVRSNRYLISNMKPWIAPDGVYVKVIDRAQALLKYRVNNGKMEIRNFIKFY